MEKIMNRMLNQNKNKDNIDINIDDNQNYDQQNKIQSKFDKSPIKQKIEIVTKEQNNLDLDRSKLMAITDMNTGLGVDDDVDDINHHHNHNNNNNNQNGVSHDIDDVITYKNNKENENNIDCSTTINNGHPNMVVDAAVQPPTQPPLSVINNDDEVDSTIASKFNDKTIDVSNNSKTINPTAKQKSITTSSKNSSTVKRFDTTTMDSHSHKRYSTESTDSSSIIQRLLDKIENLEYELKQIKQERDSLYSENERLCFQLQMINEADKHQQRSKRPQSSILSSSGASMAMAPSTGNTLILNHQYPLTKLMAGGGSSFDTGIQGVSDIGGIDDGAGIECHCNQYQPTPQPSSSTSSTASYHRGTVTPLLFNTHPQHSASCLSGHGMPLLVSQQSQSTIRTISNNNNNLSSINKANSSSSSSFSTNMDGETVGGGGDSVLVQDDILQCQCANHVIPHNLIRSQSSHSSLSHRNSLNMSTVKLSPTIAASASNFFDGNTMSDMAGGCSMVVAAAANHHPNQHHHGLPINMPSGSNLVRTSRTTGGSTTSLASNSNSVPYNYEISQQLLDKKVCALERKYGGIAAREAAIKIQRSYRSYRLTKRFRSFVSHAAKQQQILKQHQTTMRMVQCPKNECHHTPMGDGDQLDEQENFGYSQQPQQLQHQQQQQSSSYSHHHHHQQQQQYQPRPGQVVQQLHHYHNPVVAQQSQQTMMMMMSGMNITDGIGYESSMMYSQRPPSIIYHHQNDLDGAYGSSNSLGGIGSGGGGKRLQKKTSFSSTSSTGSSSSLHAMIPATSANNSNSNSNSSMVMPKQLTSSNVKVGPTTTTTMISTGCNQNNGIKQNQNKQQQQQQQQQQLPPPSSSSTSTSLSSNNNTSSLATMQQQHQQQNQINKFRITKQYSQSQSSVNSGGIIHYNNNNNNNGINSNNNSDHYAAATVVNPIHTANTSTNTNTSQTAMMNHNNHHQQQQQQQHHSNFANNNTGNVSAGSGIIMYQTGDVVGGGGSNKNISISSNVTINESTTSSTSLQMNNNSSNVSSTGQSMAAIQTTNNTATSDAYRKRLYRVGLNLFNKNPSERGIRFLIQHNFIEQFSTLDEQAKSVAIFLLTRKGVSRQMIGEYLSDLQPFNKAVLKAFVMEINLQGLIVDEALRSFQINFRFPGEAQKIERLVEAFADRYKECNPNDVLSRDSIFILAFAIIMLNTDLHKPTNMKHRMTPEQWLANLKGVFSEGDLAAQFLLNVYKRIKKQELQTGPDHSTQVMKVQSTMVGKDVPNLCVPHRRLVCYCRLYEIRDVNRKEKVGQHQRDVFLFNDLLLITKTTNRSRNQLAEYQYRSSTSLDGLHVNTFSKGFYAHGIRISRRVDQKVLALFNARNELDQKRFVEDLRESILEMDEMEQIRITKSSSLVQLNNFTTIGTDFVGNGNVVNTNTNSTTDVVGLQRQQSKNSSITNYGHIHGNVLNNENNSSYNQSSSLSSNVPPPSATAAAAAAQNPLNGHHVNPQHHYHHHYSSSNVEQQPITAATTTTASSSSTSSTMQ